MANDDLTEVGGLYANKAKSGAMFWRGKMRAEDVARVMDKLEEFPGGCELIMFSRKADEPDNRPDVKLYVKPPYVKPG